MKNNYEVILDGLTGEKYKHVKILIDQIDYVGSNKVVIQCLVPVCRFLITKIFDDYSYYMINDNKELLIRMINIKVLTNKLIDFVENYFPIAKEYFPNLDYQAESVLLFSNNYLADLVQKISDDKNNLIPRRLKLEKINEYNSKI